MSTFKDLNNASHDDLHSLKTLLESGLILDPQTFQPYRLKLFLHEFQQNTQYRGYIREIISGNVLMRREEAVRDAELIECLEEALTIVD